MSLPDMASVCKVCTRTKCGIMLGEFRIKIPDEPAARIFIEEFLPQTLLRQTAASSFSAFFTVAAESLPLISLDESSSSLSSARVFSATRRDFLSVPNFLSEKYLVNVVPFLLTLRRQPSKADFS
jgi:hypothetical protein